MREEHRQQRGRDCEQMHTTIERGKGKEERKGEREGGIMGGQERGSGIAGKQTDRRRGEIGRERCQTVSLNEI